MANTTTPWWQSNLDKGWLPPDINEAGAQYTSTWLSENPSRADEYASYYNYAPNQMQAISTGGGTIDGQQYLGYVPPAGSATAPTPVTPAPAVPTTTPDTPQVPPTNLPTADPLPAYDPNQVPYTQLPAVDPVPAYDPNQLQTILDPILAQISATQAPILNQLSAMADTPQAQPPSFDTGTFDLSDVSNPYSMTGIMNQDIWGSLIGLVDQLSGSSALNNYTESQAALQNLPGQVNDWQTQMSGMINNMMGLNPYSSSVSDSSSYTGLDPATQAQVTQLANQYSGMQPMLDSSLQAAQNLPSDIDRWSADLMNTYRTSGDDIANAMNVSANQRAAQGIMGGTEAQNLQSNLLMQLMQNTQEQKIAQQAAANQAKAAATLAMPQLGAIPQQLANQLYGMTQGSTATSGSSAYQEDPTAWADMLSRVGTDAMQLQSAATLAAPQTSLLPMEILQNLFNTSRMSYQEDPAAWGSIIANLIQSNF